MAWIDWTPDLAVDIPEIDHDHKKMLEHLNVLFAASMAGVGDEMLDEVFKMFRKLASEHFERETAVMSSMGCAEAGSHHGKHDVLLAELDALEAQAMAASGSGFSIDVVTKLRSWLQENIAEDVRIFRQAKIG
jgi:hemerythrin-like metal-binding protein